jgi:TRAP-type transport system periplasmic protein
MKKATKISGGFLTAAAAVAVMTGCSAAAGSTSSTAQTTLTLSIADPADSSVGATAQHFADEVKSKSSGAIKINVIPNGTSYGGDQAAAVTRVQNGSLDAVMLSTSVYAAVDKKMNAVSLPYLFKTTDQEAGYLAGEPGQELLADLNSIQTKGLAMMTRTPREITNSKRPISSPGDMNGLKIRVPGNPLWTKFFSAVGASPTPMNFSEVFTALQTGAIDGQENPVEVPVSSKFYEVQKYISITNHMSDAYVLALSDSKWKKLDAASQKILQDAATETATFKTKNDDDLQKKQLQDLQSHGMQVNQLSDAGLAEFQKTARQLSPEFADVIGKDFMDKTLAYVDSH